MQLLWKNLLCGKDDALSVYYYHLYEQIFFLQDTAVFFYGGMDKSGTPPYPKFLSAAAFDCLSGEKKCDAHNACKNLPIAASWDIVRQGDELLIDTGRFADDALNGGRKYRILKFSNGQLSHCGRTPLCEKKIYNDDKIYTFGNCDVYIPPNKTRKLECRDKISGSVLWQFSFVGYLYTEIVEKGGVLYFGTAGQGGHFYGLSLADGALLHDINTHGTVFFCFYKGKIYMADATGGLLEYNPESKEQSLLKMPEKLALLGDVHFALNGGRLYAAAFKLQKSYDWPTDIYAVCFDLEAE